MRQFFKWVLGGHAYFWFELVALYGVRLLLTAIFIATPIAVVALFIYFPVLWPWFVGLAACVFIYACCRTYDFHRKEAAMLRGEKP